MAKKCIAVIMIGRKKKIFQQKLANVHSDKKTTKLCLIFKGFLQHVENSNQIAGVFI